MTGHDFQNLCWFDIVTKLSPKLEFATADKCYPKIAQQNSYFLGMFLTYKLIKVKTNSGTRYTLLAIHDKGTTELLIWEPHISHINIIKYTDIEALYELLNKPNEVEIMELRLAKLEARNKELEDKLNKIKKLIGEV